MKSLELRQLIDLVAGDVDDGEKRIETIFGWQFEREMSVIRWSLGFSASLAVAILVAYFRSLSIASNSSSGLTGLTTLNTPTISPLT